MVIRGDRSGTYAARVFRRVRDSATSWFRTTWQFDPLVVIAVPFVFLFYVAVVIGPFIVLLLWSRPPLIVGALAALLGVGVMAWLFVEGFNARFLADASRQAGGTIPALHAQSWALVMRAVLATAWLVAVVGVWSAAIENELDPQGASIATDYAGLALWQVGHVVPLLDVPSTLGYAAPPVSTWGLATGIALLALGGFVVYAIVLVVTHLVAGRRWFANGS